MDPLSSFVITPETLRLVAEVDEFKGRWQALGNLAPERLAVLRRVATIESVASSTRIEGVKLTDDEVDRLLSGLSMHSFRTRDEQEVAGYADLMELVFATWADVPLTENYIKQFHQILLKHSTKDEHHAGQYKRVPNHVEAFDATGASLGVIFQTASPFATPLMMEALVAWTRAALAEGRFHPLLVVATFVVRFLAIHPFQDGNGRLSRALTTFLLLKVGYTYVPFASLERVVEDNKDAYYLALRRAQSTLDADESQLGEWVTFFLRCLVRQVGTLKAKLDQERALAPLGELDERILRIAREQGRVTVLTACALTGASRNTVKAHLQKLAESHKLVRHGKARGTFYTRG